MKTYPIMLKLRGRRAVVVGGGPVATRKARSLVGAGAEVTLVAGVGGPRDGARLPGVKVLDEDYRPHLLAGALLVFACADDAAVNRRVAVDARKAGALVNCADQPDDCDFFLPACFADGPVTVAVGTGGASPALAAGLRDHLAQAMPARTGEFAELLAELRAEVKGKVAKPQDRARILRKLASSETFELFTERGRQAVSKLSAELIRAV